MRRGIAGAKQLAGVDPGRTLFDAVPGGAEAGPGGWPVAGRRGDAEPPGRSGAGVKESGRELAVGLGLLAIAILVFLALSSCQAGFFQYLVLVF